MYSRTRKFVAETYLVEQQLQMLNSRPDLSTGEAELVNPVDLDVHMLNHGYIAEPSAPPLDSLPSYSEPYMPEPSAPPLEMLEDSSGLPTPQYDELYSRPDQLNPDFLSCISRVDEVDVKMYYKTKMDLLVLDL